MKKKNNYRTSVLLISAILLVLALLSESYFFRWDLTEGKRYSLSKATKDILENLDEPVTVTAYFTEDLAPDLAKVKEDFKDMLIEYNNISRGKVLYKFVNPNKDQESETEAVKAGIQPVLFNARDKDEVKQQKVYLGAKIQKGDDYETIPFVNPNTSMEYELSTAIKKLSVKNKPLIGFVSGHGETPVSSFQQVVKDLKVLYNVQTVNLSDNTAGSLNQYKTLVINAPTDSFNTQELNKLDDYLKNGGNIYIGINRVEGNLQNLSGKAINTGLETWLSKKGLTVDDAFVIDSRCGTVGVTQRNGAFTMTSQINFPYLPLVTNFADHPITKGLEQLIFQFASPLHFNGSSTYTFTPIAFSSEHSGVENCPVFFNINKRWTNNDFTQSKIPLAGILTAATGGKIVVAGDGDFAVNGSGRAAHAVPKDNVNLMTNSINWLSDDTGLIKLRTKAVTARPLKQISEGKKAFLKWLNFLLPVLLVFVYGLFRMQYRRNQRIKRMEEAYVK